jgi:hypothetical protein
MGDMRRGVLGIEIKLDRKKAEKGKNGEGHPRTHSGSFYYEKKNPNT